MKKIHFLKKEQRWCLDFHSRNDKTSGRLVQKLPRFQHNYRDCFTEGFTYKGGKRNIKTASLPDTLFKDPVIELPWQNTVSERDNRRFIWAARSACSKNVLRRWGEDTLETIVIGEVSPFYPLLFVFFLHFISQSDSWR